MYNDVRTYFESSLSPEAATVTFDGGYGRIKTRYFISSLSADSPKQLEHAIRAHWAVENNLHWVLDMAFDEDSNRTRQGHSASNLAVIRHIALNLIKNKKTSRVGVKTKRLKAGWSDDYLLKIIAGI